MIYNTVIHKIFNANEKEFKELIGFVKNSVNSSLNLEEQIVVNFELIKVIFEKRKIELIGSLLDFELLKTYLESNHKESNFLVHAFILTNLYNRQINLNVENYIFLLSNVTNKEYKEKIIFNMALSFREAGNYEKAIELLEPLNDTYSKLELAHNYYKINSKKELQVYNELNTSKLSDDEKMFLYVGYSKYFLRIEDYKNCKIYLKKLINLLPNSSIISRSGRYYEIAIIYEKLGELSESYYFMKKAAYCDWEIEQDLDYKLKAIVNLFNKNTLPREEAISLIRSQSMHEGNGMIQTYLEFIKKEV